MNERFWSTRRRLEVTQQQLAEKSGIDQADISRVERGWLPPADIQQRLAEALGVPADELFGHVHHLAS